MKLFKTLYIGEKEHYSARSMDLVKDFEVIFDDKLADQHKKENFDFIWIQSSSSKKDKLSKALSQHQRYLPDEKGRSKNEDFYKGEVLPSLYVIETEDSYFSNFFDADHLEDQLSPSQVASKHLVNIAVREMVKDLPYAVFYDLTKRIAINVARKYFIDHEDLISCGWETFENGKNAYLPFGGSFYTWLGKRMKFRMIDYLRSIRQAGTRRPDKKGYNLAPVLFSSLQEASSEILSAFQFEMQYKKMDLKKRKAGE